MPPSRLLRKAPVADIVQCGLGVHNIRRINGLGAVREPCHCKLLILLMLQGWLLRLDSNQQPSG